MLSTTWNAIVQPSIPLPLVTLSSSSIIMGLEWRGPRVTLLACLLAILLKLVIPVKLSVLVNVLILVILVKVVCWSADSGKLGDSGELSDFGDSDETGDSGETGYFGEMWFEMVVKWPWNGLEKVSECSGNIREMAKTWSEIIKKGVTKWTEITRKRPEMVKK